MGGTKLCKHGIPWAHCNLPDCLMGIPVVDTASPRKNYTCICYNFQGDHEDDCVNFNKNPVPAENPQPESPDIERAYQWLLNSDDFDARNLRTTIRTTLVDGADCFDLRGAAKVLVKYAASSIPALPWTTTHKVAEISKRWRMGDPNYEDIPILLKIVWQVFASSVPRQPELVSSLEEVLRALKKSFRGDPVHCADEMISRAERLLDEIDSHPLAVSRLSAKEFWENTSYIAFEDADFDDIMDFAEAFHTACITSTS